MEENDENIIASVESIAVSFTAKLKIAFGSFILRLLGLAKSGLEREFSDDLGKIRTRIHNDRKKIFKWIKSGDLEALKKKLKTEKFNMEEVDPYGANAIHLAYLYENYEIGHFLVETYPKLALKPYSGELPEELRGKYDEGMMLYTGETILHMVIVRKNYEEVRWLLDFYRDHRHSVHYGLAKLLMQSNATGRFFDPKGHFYFGGYPLQFAVCCNSIEIFDLVLSFASSVDPSEQEAADQDHRDGGSSDGGSNFILGPNVIFMRDMYGNTMLHLCVMHGLTGMFDHILSVASTILKRELQLWYSQQIVDLSKAIPFRLPDATSGHSLKDSPLTLPDDDHRKEWLNSEVKKKLNERLLLVLNAELMSPLTLAASLSTRETPTVSLESRVEMIKKVLSSTSTKVRLWKYGPVTCFKVNLMGLDVQYDMSDYKSNVKDSDEEENIAEKVVESFSPPLEASAITWLCINEDKTSICISEIKCIIESKWERYGLPLFLLDAILDFIITLLVTLMAIYVDTSFTFSPHYGFEYFVNVLFIATIIIFVSLTFSEVLSLIRRPNFIYTIRGVAKFNMLCRTLKIVTFFLFIAFRIAEAYRRGWKNSFIIHAVASATSRRYLAGEATTSFMNSLDVPTSYPSSYPTSHPTSYPTSHPTSYPTSLPSFMYNPQDYTGSKISLSLCVVACWFNLYYYLMGFKRTGPFMLTFKKVIAHDFPYFMQFFFVPLFGFGFCLSMLENNGTVQGDYPFWNTARTLWALIQKAATMNIFIDTTALSLVPNNLQWLSNLLLTSFYAFCLLIMLNLLIAIINATYSNGSNYNESIFLIEKYNIMDFYDKHLNDDDLKIQREKYCTAEGGSKNSNQKKRSAQVYPTSQESNSPTELVFEMVETSSAEWYNIDARAISDQNQKTSLFIIDPQIDFHPGGSLAVAGADQDSKRIAEMIRKNKEQIHEIFVTMDSHHPSHIAHAMFWVDQKGNRPQPFTQITYQDVVNEVWLPRDDSQEVKDWCLHYTKALERKGRMTLTIWPEHCIIGTRGHAIEPNLNAAIQEWARHSKRSVTYVMKGQNCRTEMYSALEAEVVDPLDYTTALNVELVSMLRVSGRVREYYSLQLLLV